MPLPSRSSHAGSYLMGATPRRSGTRRTKCGCPLTSGTAGTSWTSSSLLSASLGVTSPLLSLHHIPSSPPIAKTSLPLEKKLQVLPLQTSSNALSLLSRAVSSRAGRGTSQLYGPFVSFDQSEQYRSSRAMRVLVGTMIKSIPMIGERKPRIT